MSLHEYDKASIIGKGEGISMRNGFIKTLAAVAVACLGYQAFAVAPVIRQIPSPVVTDDANPVTGSYLFVYADWLDLRAFTEDDGDVANLIWSYTSVGGRYGLNGAAELPASPTSAQIVNPAAGQVINSDANIAAAPESNPDGNAFTVTIRDVVLTPYGSVSGTPAGAFPGDVIATDNITLYASDGTSPSAGQTFLAYTQAHGGNAAFVDRVSSNLGQPPTIEADLDFTTGLNGWTSSVVFGSPTLNSTGGLCINVPAGGLNIGTWVSPYEQITLVDNALYRLRMDLTTTQNAAGAVPLWDVIVQNLGGPNSDQAYIGDYLFLDNTGSANAVAGPAQGRNDFEVWYAPAAVSTPQWSNAFGVINDADDDARVEFRILDTDSSAGIGGENDSGTICLTGLMIERYDLDDIVSSLNVYNLNPIVSGINGVTVTDLLDNIAPGPGTGSNVDFLTNPMTLTPADAQGWLTELTFITPGDTNNLPISDPNYNPADIVDNYPIPWESDVVYELQVDASAPDATAENNGPDALRLAFDAKTTELLGDSYMLTGYTNRPGMPKQVGSVSPAGPQTFKMWWSGHSTTLSPVANADRLRWKVDIISTTDYNRPTATDLRNAGGIRFHAIRVNKVSFQ
jgi:hypothetical protein